MKPKYSNPLIVRLSLITAVLSAPMLQAAPLYKVNNSDNLDQLTSWSTDPAFVAPPAALATTDTWYFNEVRMQGDKTVALGGNLTIAGLALDYATANNTNNLVISTGSTLTLNGGSLGGSGVNGANYTASGIVLNRGSGGTLTINSDVALGATQSWVQGRTGAGITVNGGISLGANNLTFNVAGTGTATLGGAISGTGKFTKFNSGTLVLPVANSFSGGFQLGSDAGAANTGVVLVGHAVALGTAGVISRGAQLRSSVAGLIVPNNFSVGAGGFRLGGTNNFTLAGTTTLDASSRSIGNYGTGTVTLGGIATVALSTAAFDAASGKIIVSGAISGAGGVSVSVGEITFSGTNTYAGATVVSGGRISGTGTIPTALAMSGGSIALPGGATTTGLTLANGATFTNTPTVVFDTPPVAATTYDIFNYTGLITGAAYLKVANRGTVTDTGSKYTFVLGAQNQTRTWNTTTGTWDGAGTNAVWLESDLKFYNGDAAVFNEPAAASTVTLTGTISSTGFSVNNTTNAYTFTGGVLTGATGLTKAGAGAMTIGNGHTYTGNVSVTGGTVTGSGGVPSANTNSSFGLKSSSRTVTAENVGTNLWLTATNGSSNTFGGGGMTVAQIPTLVARNGGAIRTGKFNTVGNIILENGGHLTGSSTEASGSYGGYQFIGSITASGSGAGAFIDLNGSTRPNHLLGGGTTGFDVGDLTGDVAVDLTVSVPLANGSGDYPGIGSLAKTGAGRMLLSAANTYSGSTTVTTGTLELSGTLDNVGGISIASGATMALSGSGLLGGVAGYAHSIVNDGTLSFGGSVAQTITTNIAGSGALTKSRSGTLTLGYNDYTGATSVTGGVLAVDGDLNVGSAVSVSAGGTLRGTGLVYGGVTVTGGSITGGNGTTGVLTVGSLAFGTTGSVNIGALENYTSSAAIESLGNLTLNGGAGSITVNLPAATLPAGNYHLISSANTLPNASSFTLGTLPALGSRQSGTLVINGNFLDYAVTGINPTWTGAVSGEWSTAVLADPKNWFTNVNTDYINGDAVTFDDTATGPTTLTLAAAVTPASVIFNNSSLTYSVSGAGAIAGGTTTLAKLGTGTVTLNTANTYGGATTITEGTLALGSGATIGNGPITLTAGTLELSNHTLANNIATTAGTIAGTIAGTSGTLDGVISGDALGINATGLIRLRAVNTYTGATTITSGGFEISGSGQLNSGAYAGEIANGGALRFNTTANQTLSGSISGGGSLTKNNSGNLSLAAKSTFTGNTTVNGGMLDLTGGGGASGTIRGSVAVNAGATLRLSTGDATGYNGDAGSLTVIDLDGGTLDNNMDARIGGGNQTLGNAVVTLIGGHITGIAGSNLDFFAGGSSLTTLASSTTSTISGTALDLRQAAGVTFNVALGSTPSGVDLEISSLLTNQPPTAAGPGTGTTYGSNPLIKAGDGVMKLTGDSNYTGSTTINGGTLDLTAGNIYTGAFQPSAVVTVNSGATLRVLKMGYNVDPLSDSSLGGLRAQGNARVINGGTFEVTGGTESIENNFNVGANGGTFRYNPASPASTLTLLGNVNSNIAVAGAATLETVGNLTIGETVEGTGSLTKTGAATLTLGGANTYTGDTTVNAGTLALADNAQLKFVIGANGVSNKITGTGTVDLAGDFTLDLTAASTTSGNTWTLVDVSTLAETYQSTFTIVGFTKAAGVHTMTDVSNRTWTFTESTGVLSVVTPGGYGTWKSTNAPGQTASQDYDYDGVSNGVEYVLGGSGAGNDSGKLPTVTSSGGNLVFTSVRSQASKTADTSVKIEVGTSLGAWPSSYTVGTNTAGSSAGVTVTDNLNGTDTITLTVTQAPDASKFARLRVDVTP